MVVRHFFTVILFISLGSTLLGQETPPTLIYWDSIHLEEIKFTEFRTITHFPDEGNLIALNEQEGIIQLGSALIGMVDLKTGKIKKRLDMHRVAYMIAVAMEKTLGEYYCISAREDFESSRVKPELYGIQFDRILKYSDGSSFATLAHTVVINQDDGYNREIFSGVIVFDDQLQPLDFFPIEKRADLRYPPSVKFGGWFYDDLLFSNIYSIDHPLSYEFVKYSLDPDGIYQFSDTTNYWPNIDSGIGHFSRFYGMRKVEGLYHISLGNKLVVTKSLKDTGKVVFPNIDQDEAILHIEPLAHTDWLIGTKLESLNKWRNQHGIFSFISSDYQKIEYRRHYRLLDVVPLSISVAGHQIYILLYDRKKNLFYIEHFEYRVEDG